MSVVLAITSTQSLAMLLLAASVGGVLWWSQRNARRASGFKRPATTPAPAAGPESPKPEDLRRWEIELHELARTLTAELNTRAAVLQQLLRSAEAQCDRLEALLERQPTPPSVGPSAASQAASLAERADAAHMPAPIARARPRREEIVALATNGASQAEIVAATGAPPGEVELILGLRRAAER